MMNMHMCDLDIDQGFSSSLIHLIKHNQGDLLPVHACNSKHKGAAVLDKLQQTYSILLSGFWRSVLKGHQRSAQLLLIAA